MWLDVVRFAWTPVLQNLQRKERPMAQAFPLTASLAAEYRDLFHASPVRPERAAPPVLATARQSLAV
jgi:hypothetical protein